MITTLKAWRFLPYSWIVPAFAVRDFVSPESANESVNSWASTSTQVGAVIALGLWGVLVISSILAKSEAGTYLATFFIGALAAATSWDVHLIISIAFGGLAVVGIVGLVLCVNGPDPRET